MQRRNVVASAAVMIVLIGGCTPGAEEPASTTAPPSSSATPSPSLEGPQDVLSRWLAPGPHSTAASEYRLDDLPLPGLRAPVEVSATVVGPADMRGPVPLVVVLHGYTASCFTPDGERITTDWPCPADMKPFPSAEGFAYLQQRLASHGFLAVSVRANGVNVQATDMGGDAGAAERSALIHRHLEALAAGEVDLGADLPVPALGSVLLVGHSRGGEGVDRAAADTGAADPWRIRGEVLVGPSGFDPAERTTVPAVAVVGYCDGDVGPAPAQRYVDRPTATDVLRASVLVPGANHNFFNAEWVPGQSRVPGGSDDAFGEGGEIDPLCDPEGSGRLTPAQQQEVAAELVTVAAAGLLGDDDAALAALDGRIPLDLGAGRPWVSAVGNGRATLRIGADFEAAAEGSSQVQACRGISETEDPSDCGAFVGEGTAVHWPAAYRDPEVDYALRIAWRRPRGVVTLALREPLDLSAADALEMRTIVAVEGAPVELDVSVADVAGASTAPVSVERAALPSGATLPARLWGQQVAIPVSDLVGVDLAQIHAITLTPRSPSGTVWILDASTRPR